MVSRNHVATYSYNKNKENWSVSYRLCFLCFQLQNELVRPAFPRRLGLFLSCDRIDWLIWLISPDPVETDFVSKTLSNHDGTKIYKKKRTKNVDLFSLHCKKHTRIISGDNQDIYLMKFGYMLRFHFCGALTCRSTLRLSDTRKKMFFSTSPFHNLMFGGKRKKYGLICIYTLLGNMDLDDYLFFFVSYLVCDR